MRELILILLLAHRGSHRAPTSSPAMNVPSEKGGIEVTLETEATYLEGFPQLIVVNFKSLGTWSSAFDAPEILMTHGCPNFEIEGAGRHWRITGYPRSPEWGLQTAYLTNVENHGTRRFLFDVGDDLPPGDYSIVAKSDFPLFGEPSPPAHFKVVRATAQDRDVARRCAKGGGMFSLLATGNQREWRKCPIGKASEQAQQQAGYYIYLGRRLAHRGDFGLFWGQPKPKVVPPLDPEEPLQLFGRGLLLPWAEVAHIELLEEVNPSAAAAAKADFLARWPSMKVNTTKESGCCWTRGDH